MASMAGTTRLDTADPFDDDREAGTAQKPRHRMTITRPFYLTRHEVTLAQWAAVMGRSPCTSRRSNPY